MTPKQQKREARKRVEDAKPAPPAYFGLFNPTAIDDDPEWDIFSKSTGILQRLQQLQLLHRESDLLDLLHGCLMGPALDWFKSQPKFTSLHDFGIALAKAFPPSEPAKNSTAPQEQQEFEGSTSDRCQWCHLAYETWESHRLQYPSCDAQNQQAYESALQFLEGHASEIIEKSAISTPSGPQKQQGLKPTPELQDIGIFDPTLTCEDRRFDEATDFLQHLQQCQHQYRESDLLSLLPSCLYGPAFDIWFNKQTIMESASLSEWVEALRVDFANAPFAKVKTSKVTCMRCDSSFNSKDKLRNHVRNQHAKKPASNSDLMINTAKSACEAVEKSAVICLLDSPALQESLAFPATPRKHVSESEVAFEAIISPASSVLPIATASNALQSMENEPIQCSSASWTSTTPLESEDQEILVRKPATSSQIPESASTSEPVTSSECSSLSSLTLEYIPESTESASIQRSFDSPELQAPTATPKQIFESALTSRAVTSSRVSHLPFSALDIVSEPVENMSTQCSTAVTCQSASLTSQKPSTPFKHQLARHAYQPKQEAQKQAEDSHLSVYAVNSVCEIEETSSTLHKFLAPKPMSESAIAPRTVTLLERSNLSFPTFETMSKSTERSTTCRRCNQIFNSNNKLHEHIREHHARKPVKSLNPRVPTPELTYKTIEKPAGIRPPAPLTPQKPPTPPATPRSQISWFSINSEPVAAPTRSGLPIAPYKISPKPLESAVASCPLTPPTSPSQAPVRKHQMPHNEPYLTMDDLGRMFHGKPSPFGLRQHHNRRPSPQGFGPRQSSQPCSSTPKKPYLTMHNLGRMFDGKSRRKDLFQSQNHESSQASSGQMQITAYFKPTANQKPPINQTSKGSKPKTSRQHMPAESIRTAFSRSLPEKLADLPYKLPDVSCHLKPSNPNKAAEAVSFISILLRLLPAFLLALAFVSAMSAARMGCISAYQQAISAIGRADIEFVASGRS
ncbi:hypothetical protein G7Y79_00006g018020 [Physcia stellaris]|nr:hypothetical protein G7Y79_00006g018020 [Physcia stellaris]